MYLLKHEQLILVLYSFLNYFSFLLQFYCIPQPHDGLCSTINEEHCDALILVDTEDV